MVEKDGGWGWLGTLSPSFPHPCTRQMLHSAVPCGLIVGVHIVCRVLMYMPHTLYFGKPDTVGHLKSFHSMLFWRPMQ